MVSISKQATACLWAAWACFVIFLLGLPTWSRVANGIYFEALCKTPAKDIVCGDGQNYTEIAVRLNRHINNTYYGCGCTEGIFGDAACMVQSQAVAEVLIPLGKWSFSVSYFIGTSSGTGAMAAFSAIPFLGMWAYGSGGVEGMMLESVEGYKFIQRTLVVFQIFWGFFLIFTFGIFPLMHDLAVWVFLAALIAHFVAIACAFGLDSTTGKVIKSVCAVSIIVLVIGVLYPPNATWLGQHAFWLGECVGLIGGTAIAPILLSLKPHDADATPAHAQLQSWE